MFDFNDYSLDSKFYDVENKKVFGKIKDELKGRGINKFIGLESKMYSLISVNNEEITKVKGLNKRLRHKEFADILFNKRIIRHSMKRIQSKLHRIGIYDICKISLPCFDDKGYVLDDGINTLDYFHKDKEK